MIYLTLSELLFIAERVLRDTVPIRDAGLLESALARPKTSLFGTDVYADLDQKAAALLHSLARNRALLDGNKRLALAAAIAFLGLNGRRIGMANNEAYDLVVDVASGALDEVAAIANRIRAGSEPR